MTARVLPFSEPAAAQTTFRGEAAGVTEFAFVPAGMDAAWSLIKANQTIRAHESPTVENVIDSLDAVESMSYSTENNAVDWLAVESAFETLRDLLTKPAPKTAASAAIKARDSWNKAGE